MDAFEHPIALDLVKMMIDAGDKIRVYRGNQLLGAVRFLVPASNKPFYRLHYSRLFDDAQSHYNYSGYDYTEMLIKSEVENLDFRRMNENTFEVRLKTYAE